MSLQLLLLLVGAPTHAQEPPEPAVASRAVVDEPTARSTTCRRATGLVGGLSQTARTWAFVDDGPVRAMGSPAVALHCEIGGPRRLLIGVESAPFYRGPRIGTTSLGNAFLSVSTGLAWGQGAVQYGPVATASWGRVGAGARLVHLPWGLPTSSRQGMEYRLQAFYSGVFEVQASVYFLLSTHRSARAR